MREFEVGMLTTVDSDTARVLFGRQTSQLPADIGVFSRGWTEHSSGLGIPIDELKHS